jgi:hypothetical protein
LWRLRNKSHYATIKSATADFVAYGRLVNRYNKGFQNLSGGFDSLIARIKQKVRMQRIRAFCFTGYLESNRGVAKPARRAVTPSGGRGSEINYECNEIIYPRE